MDDMFVDVPDGRRLEVLVAGPDKGMPLVYHYGTPSAAVPAPRAFDEAAKRGLRTVVFSRPGYGESTPRPGRSVADVAADTAAVLDALGADRFVTVGKSGGGPHALACAALLPERCAAAASVAGVAPFGAEGLDWLAGMGQDNLDEFGAAQEGPDELARFLEDQGKVLATVRASDVAEALGDLLSDVDRSVLTGDFAEFTAASFRRAVLHGIAGWRDDDLAFVRDWKFRPGDGAPVAIWQGGQDRMVPYAHGEWLAEHVPGARIHLLPDEGHLSLLIREFGRVLDDLLEMATG
jgi:pimeloyl-ACP methyl ester carboxylesterase